MRVGYFGSSNHLFFCCILDAKSDVVKNGIVKQNGFLVYIAHQVAQVFQLIILYRRAIN